MVVTVLPSHSETGVMHGWNASPSRWLVHARHTPTPQPNLGPVTPSLSRSTHSIAMSAGASTVVDSPLTVELKFGISRSLADDREAPGMGARRPGIGVGDGGRPQPG